MRSSFSPLRPGPLASPHGARPAGSHLFGVKIFRVKPLDFFAGTDSQSSTNGDKSFSQTKEKVKSREL
jgi:hypothetical protein